MTEAERAAGAVPAALPPRESERLDALRSYQIVDTLPEDVYDDLVAIASAICQTPVALISLVDQDRQFIKANVGLPGVTETSRDVAFCAHAILDTKEPLVVPDASADARFAKNPLVSGEPKIRFYAGFPLVNVDGHALGTICAIDRRPRELTSQQVDALSALSRQVMRELELRRSIAQMKRSLAESLPRDTPAPISVTRPHDLAATAARARALLQQGQAVGQVEDRLRTLLDRIEQLQKPIASGPL